MTDEVRACETCGQFRACRQLAGRWLCLNGPKCWEHKRLPQKGVKT